MSLIDEPEVQKWIVGDLSYLKPAGKSKKALKIAEDEWGRTIMAKYYPKIKKQWTNLFGELIVKEMYERSGHTVNKPRKLVKGIMPDLETQELIIEVKCGTYCTGGTASEKILGVPFKYARVPKLYEKPLKIVCLGGMERECREKFGIFEGGAPLCPEQKELIELYTARRITYIAGSELYATLQ